MPGMADNIKLILWLLLLYSCSSLGFGSDLDIQCLKDVLQSVVDSKGILKSSWNFDNRTSGSICEFSGVNCWNPSEKVLALGLSNLGLGGQFPRGLENCNGMITLDLSRNNFSGPIPSDIARLLPRLSFLDLSYNSFSGEIPVNFRNITYLNDLNLDSNQLSGRIPLQLDSLYLMLFSVADNQLSGPIPLFLGERFPSSSFTGNPELCGAPLGDCPSKSSVQKKNRPSKRKWRLPRINDSSSIGAAAGFVVGFVVAFYFPFLFICSRRLRPYFIQIL